MKTTSIAILISGSGSNAINIIEYFKQNDTINVALLLSNNPNSKALKTAEKMAIKGCVFNNESFKKKGELLSLLKLNGVDFVVLAGFLRKIPVEVVSFYKNKIVNIHPSLLPKYGGKGMYGMYVHRAVIDNKEDKSGISIHFVNDVYDAGGIIFQQSILVDSVDTPKSLAKKIQQLEHHHYPMIIESIIKTSVINNNEY